MLPRSCPGELLIFAFLRQHPHVLSVKGKYMTYLLVCDEDEFELESGHARKGIKTPLAWTSGSACPR